MDLSISSQHYVKPDRSLRRNLNKSNVDFQNHFGDSDLSTISTSRPCLPLKSHRTDGRNSFREAVQRGYVRPPSTISKPFNLSRSNSKTISEFDQEQQSVIFKASKCPNFTKPFIVYRSDKPLTIPKSFKLAEKKTDPAITSRNKEEGPEEVLKRLRAKSAQKIVSQAPSHREHSLLIQKFKEFSGREINNILHVQKRGLDRRVDNSKENSRKNWKF